MNVNGQKKIFTYNIIVFFVVAISTCGNILLSDMEKSAVCFEKFVDISSENHLLVYFAKKLFVYLIKSSFTQLFLMTMNACSCSLICLFF